MRPCEPNANEFRAVAGPRSGGRAFVGTSGWAYPSWKPGFYPAAVSSKRFLEHYATRLNSVEVNYTSTKLPTAAVVDGWLAATPDTFRFSFKAPQRITQMLRLKNCAEVMAEFVAALDPVVRAGRVGVILLQLPPNFKADHDRLGTFLAEASQHNLRMAFEFRHESWFAAETYACLRARQTALCVAESDALATPDASTAPFAYYRLRKSRYGPKKLAALAETLAARSNAGEVFAYFKHEDEPIGARRAVQTYKRLSRLSLPKAAR